jgi:hypothetical protein
MLFHCQSAPDEYPFIYGPPLEKMLNDADTCATLHVSRWIRE